MEPLNPESLSKQMNDAITGLMDKMQGSIKKIQSEIPNDTKPIKVNGKDCALQLFDNRVTLMFATKDETKKYFDEFGDDKNIIYGLQQEIKQLQKPWYKRW